MPLLLAELEFKTGPHAGRRVTVRERLVVDSDGEVSSGFDDDAVGHRKMLIERRGTGFRVRDAATLSGTRRIRVPGAMRGMLPTPPPLLLNGAELKREAALKNGDQLQVGEVLGVFHIQTSSGSGSGSGRVRVEAAKTTAFLSKNVKVRKAGVVERRFPVEKDADAGGLDAVALNKERYLLHELMRLASDEEDPQRILELMTDAVRSTLIVDRTVVVLLARLGDRLTPAVVRRGALDPAGARIGVPRAVLEKCVREGVSTLVQTPPGPDDADISDSELEVPKGASSSDSQIGIGSDSQIGASSDTSIGIPGRSLAVVPLSSRGRTLGAIYVDRDPERPPLDENDLRLLATTGKQVGMALERTRLLKEARGRAADLVNTSRELERRSAELEAERAWLRAVIEGIDTGLILLDPRGRPALSNATAAKLLERLGISDPTEAPALGQLVFADVARTILRDADARCNEEVAIEGAEEDQILEVRGSPVHGSTGPEGVALLVRDITDERFRDARLRQSEKLSAIGEMMAGVAHELNNPLAAINGFAELLGRTIDQLGSVLDSGAGSPLDAEAADQVREVFAAVVKDAKSISQESIRCHKVVRNLLGLARRRDPERTEVNPNDVVTAITSILSPEARRRGIRLDVELEENMVTVLADGHELQQVLYNLVMNAIHAAGAVSTEDGQQGRVKVTSTCDGDTTAVLVADNGPGIEEKVRRRIFQPFFTTKPEGQGTGLGLPIAHRIVKAHGGQLLCDSEVGVGTRFTVQLPVLRSLPIGSGGGGGDQAASPAG